MLLHLNIHHPCPPGHLSLNLTWQGRVLGLTGPSGSGKTTLLHLIAGLLSSQHALITFNSQTFCDTTRHIHLPPQQRRIGFVFQEHRLFPHLTVLQNLQYALKLHPPIASHSTLSLHNITQTLQLSHLLHRTPAQISGGEAQRVALGRVLLSHPQLLLLDEPLTFLDAALKSQILDFLQHIRNHLHIPMIYVSHDPREIVSLADEILTLSHGSFSSSTTPSPQVPTKSDSACLNNPPHPDPLTSLCSTSITTKRC